MGKQKKSYITTACDPLKLNTTLQNLIPQYFVLWQLGEKISERLFFFLCWVFIAAQGLSLVVGSEGYSLVAVLRLLTVVASLVAEHRLQGTWASVVVIPGL